MAVGVEPRDDPSTTSGDYNAMSPGWEMISDILAGAAAIRAKREKYLPKFQKESDNGYKLRLEAAPWRPEFEGALNSLSAKPFSKTVTVNPDAPEIILGKVVNEKAKERRGGLVDDIDGQGNSLHVFAREAFRCGVGYGIEGIYVAFPSVGPALTIAQEKQLGIRPYWVHLRARDIIDLKFKVVGGRTVVSRIRIREDTVEEDGFAEKTIHRIRMVSLDDANRVLWQTWIKDKEGKYQPELSGTMTGVSEIPVALFFAAPREGNYRIKPPMLDLADVQIELYRTMSRADNVLTLAGAPMLVGKGLMPPQPEKVVDGEGRVVETKSASQVEVGPGVVLFAPPQGDGVQPDWNYIQPDAKNLKEVREQVDDVMEDFRRLALQPTTPKSGNMVATGQAIDAAKAHTAIEAWALNFADTLNQALMFTMQWLKLSDTVSVVMHTDFGIDLQGSEEARVLGDAQKRGVISAKTEREELARRGVLGPSFDEEREEQRIAEEREGLEPEEDIDPRTGEPIDRSKEAA